MDSIHLKKRKPLQWSALEDSIGGQRLFNKNVPCSTDEMRLCAKKRIVPCSTDKMRLCAKKRIVPTTGQHVANRSLPPWHTCCCSGSPSKHLDSNLSVVANQFPVVLLSVFVYVILSMLSKPYPCIVSVKDGTG